MTMLKRASNKQKVDFALRAPGADTVQVAGTFTEWAKSPLPLKRLKDGLWKKSISLPPGRYEYRFIVDGQWQDDPDCPARVPNEHGTENCVKVVP
jgi:1,4-alpha-glucan branching enzyme